MPRRRKKRIIEAPPLVKGFIPIGNKDADANQVVMQLEEYEAVKLVIHDALSQDMAATKMAVSRPTLTRIYNSALKKIGQALVEGRSLIFEGGEYKLMKDKKVCSKCLKVIGKGLNQSKCLECSNSNLKELLGFNV